ncbi:hypothetical protein CAPTEDRAFT_179091 [Capitella teleta]|uniref:26S proteasome non-ATPase regulatory subunit 4 n=1 Tax=Capitella teleta TaxID=283909 RepID=R7TS54_CAPTE|nr:hypothetical protein CAPTEDRAFT_179091 [Capitella teleta]|eukprot:ELT94296.1 hypothetical protein CAPTEDRAFT_179091 [Capitella teleta]
MCSNFSITLHYCITRLGGFVLLYGYKCKFYYFFYSVDDSDFMRNGDFVPTRLQAQQDAVNLICHSKTRSNPENNVGLLALTSHEVLVTLTADVGKLLACLHQVEPNGNIKFVSAVRVAHLALKHRQGKNHKMRIVLFIGSPVLDDEKEMVKLAKRLKKEKVNVDVINFGEESVNTDKLSSFVNTINGKDGASSHLLTVAQGPMLSDALISSPIVVGEDGTGAVPSGMSGFEFGIDPNEDPELALALRVSMEEQRARQEDEARKVAAQSATDAGVVPAESTETDEEVLLKQALEMSMQQDEEQEKKEETSSSVAAPPSSATMPDLSMMSEEDQIAYAMQMSLSSSAADTAATPMETDAADKEEDYSEVMDDPAFLQSVLQELPGVDPQSPAIQSAMGQLTQKDGGQEKKDDKKDSAKK